MTFDPLPHFVEVSETFRVTADVVKPIPGGHYTDRPIQPGTVLTVTEQGMKGLEAFHHYKFMDADDRLDNVRIQKQTTYTTDWEDHQQ